MPEQKRIYEYFKSVSNKRILHIKKRFESNCSPNRRRRKKRINNKKDVLLSQHIAESDSMLDCSIIYERVNKVHDSCLNDVDLTQKEDKIISCNVSLHEKDCLENMSQDMFDTECILLSTDNLRNEVKEKTVNANKFPLITLTDELECPSNFNESAIMDNNDMQLKKTSTSTVKTIKCTDNGNYLDTAPNKKLRTDKNNFSLNNSNNSLSSPKQLNYIPKVPSGKLTKINARKKLFDNINLNVMNIRQAIEHMNLAKQGAIPLHNFELKEIYSRKSFDYQYNNINTNVSMKYDLNDINLCNDLNSEILFDMIFTVFSNPVNCGYFDESELDFIYSIITLPIDAQMLLARMTKRKRGWFRKTNIHYPEIAEELKDTFEVLVSRSICTFDIKDENLHVILELLKLDEINHLCQKLKITSGKNKGNNIQKLLKLSKHKPLFLGMSSPSNALYDSVFNMLDYCVSISMKTWNIIDRIITLLIPHRDPKLSVADIYYMLGDIYLGKTRYPNIHRDYFPVFSNKLHLISYIEARSTLSAVLQHIDKKDWKEVQNCGNLAMDKLPNLLKTESLSLQNCMLPMHVRRFMPGYTWLKILDKSIDAFKKNEDKKQVIEVLTFLLKQDCHMHAYKGKWYAELALIEMYHHKNVETSASIIIEALDKKYVTQVDKVNLMERANKILKKKTGVTSITRFSINKVLHDYNHCLPKSKSVSVIVDALLMPRNMAGSKSIWCIENCTDGKSYGSVENVAIYYYEQQGFPSGWHCEGALPIILFFTLFWEELYNIYIPGAFITPYQDAPNDLFTEEFYENRKEKIDTKLQKLSNLNSESLSNFMEESYKIYKQFKSEMSSLHNNIQLKEIVHCIGVKGVLGICKRLIENFKLWKAGFPDLIVWNYSTKEHKIVEVKGPRDVLSTKQRLWLEYLYQLGLNTELCLVQVTVQGPWK